MKKAPPYSDKTPTKGCCAHNVFIVICGVSVPPYPNTTVHMTQEESTLVGPMNTSSFVYSTGDGHVTYSSELSDGVLSAPVVLWVS